MQERGLGPRVVDHGEIDPNAARDVVDERLADIQRGFPQHKFRLPAGHGVAHLDLQFADGIGKVGAVGKSGSVPTK